MTAAPLTNCRVLVTRPAAQADALCDAINAAGGEAVRFPVIRIEPRPSRDIAKDIASMPAPDIIVFVSRNAVDNGASHFSDFSGDVAAIGRTTADTLATNGLAVTIDPGEGFSSEHLLAHKRLQDVSGQTVLIIRGENGRALLGNTLEERGAKVHLLTVYSRKTADISATAVAELDSRWQSGGVDVVSVMSVATFEALIGALPATALLALRETPLVAPGERVIQTIGKLVPGIPAIQASGPRPEDIVSALSEWRHSGTNQ